MHTLGAIFTVAGNLASCARGTQAFYSFYLAVQNAGQEGWHYCGPILACLHVLFGKI